MKYEPYKLHADKENTRCQFQSIGKRGIFEKVILFTPLSELTYNLALLDYNPADHKYDDLSVTDNGDMPVILSTSFAAISFFYEQPSKYIHLFYRKYPA